MQNKNWDVIVKKEYKKIKWCFEDSKCIPNGNALIAIDFFFFFNP